MAGSAKIRKGYDHSRQRPLTTCNVNDIDDSSVELTDLSQLKEVSQRLNLATRRPSTVQWQQIIEFRKSMGLYSSDVHPEFLDRIAETKMKDNSAKSLPNSGKSHRSSSKSPKVKRIAQVELNNNVKSWSPKLWRSKNENRDDSPKKNGLSIFNLHSRKDKSGSKKFKSILGKKTEEHTNSNLPSTCSNETEKNVSSKSDSDFCESASPEKSEHREVETDSKTCRLRLSDDELDEDLSGMSEMSIRYHNITKALRKIRRDLIVMRVEDNKLARKLLDARSEINIIRLRQSCDEHAEMLDDVTYEMEEEDMLPGLIKACDLPSRPPGSLMSAFSSLRNIGVSRMNLNRRRFSIR